VPFFSAAHPAPISFRDPGASEVKRIKNVAILALQAVQFKEQDREKNFYLSSFM